MISFELFGQFENVITDRAAFFAYAMACQEPAGRPGGRPARRESAP